MTLVAVAARLARLHWILLFAALPMLYRASALFRGLEAAAALFMLGLFFLSICLFARNPKRYKWSLTAVAFALPWVRLEHIAISLAATGALCLIGVVKAGAAARRVPEESVRSIPALDAITPLCGAVAGILVYFAYNYLVFGGIVPVSAAIKHDWSQELWDREGGYSIVQNFQDVLYIPVFDYELLVALEVCAYLLLVWWFARRSRNRNDWLLLAFMVSMFGLAAGHLAKFAQTVLTVHPYFGRYGWYFVPAYLMMVLIVPVRCYVALHLIRRFIGTRSPKLPMFCLSLGIVLLIAIFLFTRANFTGPFRFVDQESESTYHDNWLINIQIGTRVMNRVLPEDSIIGSWDAGVIGYFSDFPVVNLDGLVNSYDYFHATKEHAWGREFKSLHRAFGISHLANAAGAVFDNVLFESPTHSAGRGRRQKFTLASVDPLEDVDVAAWFWERIEPNFDYHQNGVGLIVDGRLAQAFARDCAPDELIVWSWTGQGGETVVKPGTNTHRNPTGLCVGALVLPRDALPPVRVGTMTATDYLVE